jgi:NAD(P)-dependent dehydrogenase (short-subunit alcohol dehydrogenase family)
VAVETQTTDSASQSGQGRNGQNRVGTVLVTGAASGLGAAIVAAVRAAGGTALALDRVPVEGVPHEIVDLAHPREAEAAVRRVVDANGGTLDAVVTAAGTDFPAPLSKLDGDSWDQIVAVNLLGTAAVVRAALPYLETSQGKVLTVGSTLSVKAVGDATAYCASKFGVVGFTRALAAELAGKIGVTLLIPGGMSTHFFDDRDPQYKPGPDAKLNDPANVAAAALFALQQPPGCEIKELVVTASTEPSYP